jgi:hypothetical protein
MAGYICEPTGLLETSTNKLTYGRKLYQRMSTIYNIGCNVKSSINPQPICMWMFSSDMYESSLYSKTCPRRNVNKAETCSMWTNSVVPARRIGITVLFILYNVESAQRGNGKQYLKNFFKNYLYTAESVLKICLHLSYFGTCVDFIVLFEN